jgi:hypothetical protein
MPFAEIALALWLGAAPATRAIEVPPALSAIVGAPELSGLVWSPQLERYLVVTDDTGDEAPHAPLVLALDRSGRLDPSPVPIAGIESLNDPEAICAGPEGTFFLTTSHSPNKKGKTKADRRALLWLELRGRKLVVRGRLDLTAVEGGRSPLEIVEAAPDARLDIEALAYRDGALYVGLKSPLGKSGEAAILRLADVAGAMRSGRIGEKALSLWARLPLCLEVEGERICQGISDMLFLDDGSLVLTGNSPKGAPKDGGGALWSAAAPVGSAAPRMLERFPGLKPEGVAVSPSRGLAVVFDRGSKVPLWIELAPTAVAGNAE